MTPDPTPRPLPVPFVFPDDPEETDSPVPAREAGYVPADVGVLSGNPERCTFVDVDMRAGEHEECEAWITIDSEALIEDVSIYA